MDWDKHQEAAAKQEAALVDLIRQVALSKVQLERTRNDRSLAPAVVSDAAIAYRTKETEMNEAVAALRDLHAEAFRSL